MTQTDVASRLRSAEDFEDELFEGGSYPALDLRNKRFAQCRFEAVSMDKAQLQSVVFDECTFVRCDLSMALVGDCSFRDVRFEHTKLMGIDWTVARDLLFDVSFEGCVLSYGVFAGRKMRKTELVDCVAHEVDFSGSDLTEASFAGTDLRDAVFNRTKLVKTDLSSALHYRIDPSINQLSKTRFSMEAGLETLRSMGILV
ncbi:MAG: pentapeptide repeat-containing protein [Myxococcales bacterium]|nr:pentapeptide repeat-containing protein [Myxococcales bacterium]MCB9628334.1 pentapeptide repeat-containing protein [Sandaracinaceae bacterium]